jgi:hypothetical protein
MDTLVVKPKNSLKRDLKVAQIKDQVVARLREFKDLHKYKHSNEYLNLAVNLIEYLVIKKDGVNKKELLLGIWDELFPDLTTEDKQQISQNVEYLFDNGLIKKTSYFRLFCCSLREWLTRKFL